MLLLTLSTTALFEILIPEDVPPEIKPLLLIPPETLAANPEIDPLTLMPFLPPEMVPVASFVMPPSTLLLLTLMPLPAAPARMRPLFEMPPTIVLAFCKPSPAELPMIVAPPVLVIPPITVLLDRLMPPEILPVSVERACINPLFVIPELTTASLLMDMPF